MLKALAFDFGASSGRAILGSFDGEKLYLDEKHRFPNEPVSVNGSIHWDILRLFHEMKQGIARCVKEGTRDIASIGVDTWGVDFGLLDKAGQLLGNPVHYRDNRTDGMIEKASSMVSKSEIFSSTGIQFQKFNTLYQLLSMHLANSPILENASTLLFTPDLFNYFLTGEKVTEYTIASTSQMVKPGENQWAEELLRKLGIPVNILTKIVAPGTVIGRLGKDVADELNAGDIPVVAVAGHDTGSAVLAVPAQEKDYAFLSSGTWSLLGVELARPLVNETTFKLNYTNEGGAYGTTRLLQNIMGLWIYQECKRTWDKEDRVYSFEELECGAMAAEPFAAFINPDDDIFYRPGNMPARVAEFCRKTGQNVPESKGAVVRCVMESLALKYRMAVEELEKIIGHKLNVIHVVGGGCKNIMLNQFSANATCKPVITGPIEATATGNLICQLIASGELADIKEGRDLVRRSFVMNEYVPQDTGRWNEAYDRFLKIVKGS